VEEKKGGDSMLLSFKDYVKMIVVEGESEMFVSYAYKGRNETFSVNVEDDGLMTRLFELIENASQLTLTESGAGMHLTID
jgi:hypothetical protein